MASATEIADSGGEIQPAAVEALAHPKELKAMVDLRIGDRVLLTATARTTPAALEAAGVEFISANGGGAGVRLKATSSP